ncbi:pentatricopeptide repeat-containing protein At4g18520, chloroplastic isoform X2 [Neltuma alba]|uniref:pentatricopeptide repeat-containing protein At4g18520, chloroplastic isoform X2 n=1 Tax=Neltuma alba TaxID=207710 RepID=UPI0010A458F9|nr:pentatricopeptide repeat-containing protein At4g18520, chloroplastic isoform X2 [Prosopis alba]
MELSAVVIHSCCSIPSKFPTFKAYGDFSCSLTAPIRNIVRVASLNFSTKDLANPRSTCLSIVHAYEAASACIEASDAAELEFQDIINYPFHDDARKKMDNMDEKNQCLNPRLESLGLARKVFDGMSRRNTVTWTAMINGYLNHNMDDEALELFSESIKHEVQANNKMFVCLMNLCGKKLDLQLGKQIHASILKGRWKNLIVHNSVLHFYAKCGDMSSAFLIFNRMVERDVVCWTTMITSCSQQGLGHEAFTLLSQMLGNGFIPNEYTVCSALKACGEIKALKMGRQLHGAMVKKICKNDVYIGTSLVDVYAKCGEIADSRQVFDRMKIRNTATWTSIISGCARNGLGEEAISLFRSMKRQRVYINKRTIVSVLMACGSIKNLLSGREVHGQIIRSNIHSNMYIGSTLVWFYSKCKEYSHAIKVLHHMPFRDVVSWTAIISGSARLGHEPEALEFLKKMVEEGVLPNSFTHSSALKACAKLEALMQGKLIHSYATKTPALRNVFVSSALIYMYAKCGYVSEAFQIFDSMPERNLVSWKAMIMGYARNGHCREALKLMYRMRAEGFEVDDYILATVLTTCGDIQCDIEALSSHYLRS